MHDVKIAEIQLNQLEHQRH